MRVSYWDGLAAVRGAVQAFDLDVSATGQYASGTVLDGRLYSLHVLQRVLLHLPQDRLFCEGIDGLSFMGNGVGL